MKLSQPERLPVQTYVRTLQGLELSNLKGRHCQTVACSAVSGDGLLTGFDWLVGDISSRVFLLEQ